MKLALRDFVAVQNLEKTWPAIIDSIAKITVQQVIKGATRELNEKSSLSQAERAAGEKFIQEMAPKIADDVSVFQRGLDIKSLITDMSEEVYPKYYTAKEIREFTTYYGSVGYKKGAVFAREIDIENAATGESKAVLWRRYESKFTPQEMKQMHEFNNSALGRKHQTVGAKIKAESLEFMYKRTAPEMNKISERYGEMLAQRLKASSK
ncbi:MAG: hypothetical protein V4495_04640 [Pseudomonadota bacterium]